MSKLLLRNTFFYFFQLILLSTSDRAFSLTLRASEIPDGFAAVFVRDLCGQLYVGSGVVLKEGQLFSSAHLFTSKGWAILPTTIWVKTPQGFRSFVVRGNAILKHPSFSPYCSLASEMDLFMNPKYMAGELFSDLAIIKAPNWASANSRFRLGKAGALASGHEISMNKNLRVLTIQEKAALNPRTPPMQVTQVDLRGKLTNMADQFYYIKETETVPEPGDSGGPLFYEEDGINNVLGLVHRASNDWSVYVSLVADPTFIRSAQNHVGDTLFGPLVDKCAAFLNRFSK